MSLVINVPGYTDVTGHTEYIIKTTVGDQQFVVQHRFSNFLELHDVLITKLSKLPAVFPVGKSVFNSETVKQGRVEKLQEYLRTCVKLSGERPHNVLLKFLRVELATLQPPTGGAAAGASDGGDVAYGDAAGPVGSFLPFSGPNGAFTPERPEDINEGLREGIKAGDTPLCLQLIEAKADPLYRDRQGNTPLHMACLFNRTDVAKALLLAGADLTVKNGAGELPERMASVSLKMKFNTFKHTGQIG